MKYNVEISVRYGYTVDADGIDEATDIAQDKWENSKLYVRRSAETEFSTHTTKGE